MQLWLIVGAGLLWILPAAAEKNEAQLSGFVSVGTFNTYMFNGAPAVEERKNVLIRALQNKKENGMPDILCLQEVFMKSLAADIAREVRDNYPYHASFQDLSNGPSSHPACSKDEIQAYRTCLQRCPTPPGVAVTNCTIANCSDITAWLTQSCYSCLLFESRFTSGDVSPPDILEVCSSSVPEDDYSAPYGILMLSKYQLSDITPEKFFDSHHKSTALLPRGYIAAKIDDYVFVCTHLQAVLSLRYDGPPQFTSYEEEQANEVKFLLQQYKDRSDVIMLGDFNHGPAVPGCTAEVPFNYNLMVSNGLFSATVRWINTCTFCRSNTFLENGPYPSTVLDHIYIHSNMESAVVEVYRMFDTLYTSDPVVSHLSDHFGVRAVLDFAKLKERVCPAPHPFRAYSKQDSAL